MMLFVHGWKLAALKQQTIDFADENKEEKKRVATIPISFGEVPDYHSHL